MFLHISVYVFIFCVTLLFQFAPVEAVITAITDSFPKLQRRRILVTAVVCVIMGLMGIPFICQVSLIAGFINVRCEIANMALHLSFSL